MLPCCLSCEELTANTNMKDIQEESAKWFDVSHRNNNKSLDPCCCLML